MPIKDYYSILQIEPSATIGDIKKSYRKLAMEYHPDKNSSSVQSAARFREIQEAYAMLSDPIKRETYHRERWLSKATGQPYAQPKPSTPYHFLLKTLELERFVSVQDRYRMDRDGLAAYLKNLLSEDAIDMLLKNDDVQLNARINNLLLSSATPLHYRQVLPLQEPLVHLAGTDTSSLRQVEKFFRLKKNDYLFNKNKMLITVLVAVAICVLIFFVAGR